MTKNLQIHLFWASRLFVFIAQQSVNNLSVSRWTVVLMSHMNKTSYTTYMSQQSLGVYCRIYRFDCALSSARLPSDDVIRS